jgi:dipeptidyl aminopeptidase/acylaminoacyl peptidase/TPR repeat protein
VKRFVVGAVLVVALGACAQACLRDDHPPSPFEMGPSDFESRRARAEEGDPAAQYELGLAYVAGREVGADPVEAARWLRRAAEQGHAKAQVRLGDMYGKGSGVAKDEAEALRWYRRAAEHGEAHAEHAIGLVYFWGLGVAQDDGQALRWFRRAADRALAAAQHDLGWMYFSGRGVARDDFEGVRWYRRAVEQENAKAQYDLGFAYSQGRGVERDDREAVRLLRLAAAQGETDAQCHLGFMYFAGHGVPRDVAESATWFERAARQGSAKCQSNLAAMYVTGLGVPQDFEEAARWFRQAADQDEPDAEAGLGLLYERGLAVPPDPIRAYLWYHLAASHGKATALQQQEALTRRMTPAQLDEARRLAPVVKPGHEALRTDLIRPSAATSTGGSTSAVALGDLIPRAALFVGDHPARPLLSPDGRRLAYLARWNDVYNLWVRTIGEHDDRLLTRETERDLWHFRWQCDGEHLLFLQDRDGDQRWRLYQADLAGNPARDLTPTGAGSVSSDWIGGACSDPDRGLVLVHADGAALSAYRADLRSGRLVSDTKNPGDVTEWAADRAQRVHAALALTPEGYAEVRVRADDRAPWRVVQRWGLEETDGHLVGFTDDGRHLLLTSSVGAATSRLLRLDLATGQSVVLAEDPRYDVGAVLSSPVTREIQGVRFVRDRAEWMLLDQSLKPDFDVLRSVCGGDVGLESRDRMDRTWVARCDSDSRPPVYYLYVRATRSATPLFAPDPTLAGREFARMQPFEFRARDGLTLHAYLTFPVGAEPRGLPMVLLVHGGPWARDAWGWDPEAQWLANRGYAVLQVNFRGSAGYGKAHLRAADGNWGGRMLDDLLDAERWAIGHGYARQGKVCLMGWSYGGYATLAALAFAPDAFACGVSLGGVSHLPAQVRAYSPPARWYWEQHVGRADPDDAFLRARSPSGHAASINAPLLLAHGASDRTVERLQSDLMASALRSYKRTVVYLVLPGEGHSLRNPANRLRFLALTEQFLSASLGGRVEPRGSQDDFTPFLR